MHALAAHALERLTALGNDRKALEMAAYMRTTDPFLGVPTPARRALVKRLAEQHSPGFQREYEAQVAALWELEPREGRYLAIDWAVHFKRHIALEALPLYERMIREGAWWDTVDGIAAWLVGPLVLGERAVMGPVLEAWIEDPCLWIRRSAVLAHLKHKARTDEEQLFRHCLRLAPEKDFFIRKAIGWALREYSKTQPETVRAFMTSHRSAWSGLTWREGMKVLNRTAT